MKFKPHDYQQLCIDDAVAFGASAKPGDRRLYVSPTGSGKSVMMVGARAQGLTGWWILTPRVEIIAGLLDKIGEDVRGMTLDDVVRWGLVYRITTPIRYKAMLLRGEVDPPPGLIVDEAHHDLAATWQHTHMLCGNVPVIGFTATPFRGTPKGTQSFLNSWGDPIWVLTYPQARDRGVISIPTCRTLPLVDDDLVEIVNGELSLSKISAMTKTVTGQVAEYAQRFRAGDRIDRPTMFALPTREAVEAMSHSLTQAGLPWVVVDGETNHHERNAAFKRTLDCQAILLQIGVVSEGVDLAIRRIIDLRPTMSPVFWLQLIGREMRPTNGGPPPEYICTNRNLLRHGYLLDGCLPSIVYVEAQAVFPPGKRAFARVFGFESIGRFKASQIPLADGVVISTYNVCAVEDNYRVDYFAVVHPAREDVVWCKAKHYRKEDGTLAYGSWVDCDPPDNLEGFASAPPRELSPKQVQWWKRSAAGFNLHPDFEPNRREFALLPVACDSRRVRRLLRGF